MGTVFQVPWTRLESWPGDIAVLQKAGFTVASLALSDDSVSLDDFAALPALQGPDARLAMVMGTEGDGLGQRTIAASDYTVKIPMDHGVDSLNVAAASAVVFWATRGIGARSRARARHSGRAVAGGPQPHTTRPELETQPRPRQYVTRRVSSWMPRSRR